MVRPSPADLPTCVDLLQRCVDEPGKHLDEQACFHFDLYLFGYSATGWLRGTECPSGSFEAVIEKDFGIGNLSGYSFSYVSFLVAVLGEPRALHRKLEYMKALHTPLPILAETSGAKGLLDLLRKGGGVRQRPGMYLGNQASSTLLWSLISGGCWAETDSGVQNGPVKSFSIGFQAWIEKKHPFSRGIPWGRTLLLIGLNSAKASLDSFFSYYDSYMRYLKKKEVACSIKKAGVE